MMTIILNTQEQPKAIISNLAVCTTIATDTVAKVTNLDTSKTDKQSKDVVGALKYPEYSQVAHDFFQATLLVVDERERRRYTRCHKHRRPTTVHNKDTRIHSQLHQTICKVIFFVAIPSLSIMREVHDVPKYLFSA